MRQIGMLVTVIGFVLSVAFGAQAQVDEKKKLKKKAEEKQGEQHKDLKGKAQPHRPGEQNKEDEDEGSNVGAIVGGVAATAIVGTVIATKKGGGADDKSSEKSVNFGSMDGNKDGSLALAEFTSAMSEGFKSADKDGDGNLTRDEAVAEYSDRGGQYFDSLDSEKRGSITMDTLDADAKQAFEWADANGDGKITAAEKSAATTQHEDAEKQQKANPGKKLNRLARKVT